MVRGNCTRSPPRLIGSSWVAQILFFVQFQVLEWGWSHTKQLTWCGFWCFIVNRGPPWMAALAVRRMRTEGKRITMRSTAMTSRLLDISDLIVSDNCECSCFGSLNLFLTPEEKKEDENPVRATQRIRHHCREGNNPLLHFSLFHSISDVWPACFKLPPTRLMMSWREHTDTLLAKAQRYDRTHLDLPGLFFVLMYFMVISGLLFFPVGQIARRSFGCTRLHTS